MSEIDDRRQRAREAFDDEMSGSGLWAERLLRAREAAIEVCTQVRLTDEVLYAAATATGMPAVQTRYRIAVHAAFTEAGIEVVP